MPIDLLSRRRAAASVRRRRPASPARADRLMADLPRWMDKAKALPDIRWAKVARIREALGDGSYDVEARLQGLLADLPDEMAALRTRPTAVSNHG